MTLLTVAVALPTADLPGPLTWLVIGLQLFALVGALPSLLVIGLPAYFVGNLASGDLFFLSGSMALFVCSFVLSVLANAVLIELVVRRRAVVAPPDATAGVAAH